MIRFLTPVRGARIEDIQARTALLQQAPTKLRTGFELILLGEDCSRPAAIVENLRKTQFPVRSVHVPFPQYGGNYAAYDLRLPDGQEKIRVTAQIAKQVGARVVVVHSQLAYSLSDWLPEQFSLHWRDQLFGEIFSVIKKFQQEFPVLRFCLENMPLPLFADTEHIIFGMRFNPCLITLQDMQQAAQAGVSLTFDICHYDMMRRLWHKWLDEDGVIDQIRIQQRDQIVGVYPAGRQPDYIEVVQSIAAALGHIHLADSTGLWQNTNSTPAGGLALGTGDQSVEELATLLHYLESSPDTEYTINLEVKDKDMHTIQETAQSLHYLAQLLYKKLLY